MTEDDKVSVTGLEKTSAYQDQTLGKVEVGGNYNLTDNLSAYGQADYTFSSKYKATSLGFGLNYSW